MPAVVAADVAGAGPEACRALQSDLMSTYRADFWKYSGRLEPSSLDAVLLHAARALGRRFVYARVDRERGARTFKQALHRLSQARLCHLVPHTAANGHPLAAQVNHRVFKVLLGDVGLYHALLATPASRIFPPFSRLAPQVRGQLAEQLAGQQLRLAVPKPAVGPQVFYWQRAGGRAGELDYVVAMHGSIVPIEVKAGAAGAMKSLHQFMADKSLARAVRVDSNPPSVLSMNLATTTGQRVSYELVNLPHYLLWNLGAILETSAEPTSR